MAVCPPPLPSPRPCVCVCVCDGVLTFLQDIARYINSTKGDTDSMKQIEEVEQSLVDYRGPPLHQCGRYHLDGELRLKPADIKTDKKE